MKSPLIVDEDAFDEEDDPLVVDASAFDDGPDAGSLLVSSHATPPAGPPRRNPVKERLEFQRKSTGTPLAGLDQQKLQDISATGPSSNKDLTHESKLGWQYQHFPPEFTNLQGMGALVPPGTQLGRPNNAIDLNDEPDATGMMSGLSAGALPPPPGPKVSTARKVADFIGMGGAATGQAALEGVGGMVGGTADFARSLGDAAAEPFIPEEGDYPKMTGADFAGKKPGAAAPVTWGGGGWAGQKADEAKQALKDAGRVVGAADSPRVIEARRILSQVEQGEAGDVIPTLLDNPNSLALLFGSGAGSLIPQVAASVATPGLSMVPMFTQELAGIEEQQKAYEQATGQNIDPAERLLRQAGTAGAIAGLEQIVPGEIAKGLKGRGAGTVRSLANIPKEGVTEGVQRVMADVGATPDGQPNWAGALMEGIAGAGGAGMMAPSQMGPAYEGPKVKGRDYGDEFLKHRKNVAAYKSAKEKLAAHEKHAAGREELSKLEDQLQAVVNQAGETQDPKAAKAAAALKQKADSLRVELGQVQLAPLSQEDELWIARGAPKFGDALGGGATEAASVEGRAIRSKDEDGNPIRLGYTVDQVEAKLDQWREVDPKLRSTKTVVHDSILSPGFFAGLPEEMQERVKRAIANGADPAELSTRVPVPGFYRNGQIHVLAPALISLDHLNELVGGHELTHDVIDNLQPDEVVQLFGRGGKEKTLGALARRAKKKDQLGYTVGKEYADETPEIQGEEVLAGATEYAGTRGPASRLDQARAAVKDRLRAALPDWAQGVLGAASDAEIRVLLDRTRQIAAERAKSGSVTVAGRGPQKAAAPAEGKAPSLTQLGQAINDAIPDAVALEAAMRQIQSDDPDTIMAGIDALLATNATEVPPGMKPQPRAQQPQEPARQQAQPLPEPSVDVDEMLATQEANDRARLQAERDEAAARADAAEKALKVLEAQRKAEQDQKAKDAKAAKDAEAGRAVLEQLPDEEARRAEEARTQRLLDAARSGDVDPSGALTPAIHQFLGQDAMDRVLANPLGPEAPRTKSLKKQPPGTAPTEAVPPTTVPPAAGELQPKAPTGKAPKKGGKTRRSIRSYLGDDFRERDNWAMPLIDERRKARENKSYWARFAVPDRETASYSGEAARRSAFKTLTRAGITGGKPIPGVEPGGVHAVDLPQGGTLLVGTWKDGTRKGLPAYAWGIGPSGDIAWAHRFDMKPGAVEGTREASTPTLESVLKKTDPEHPFRVMQGELAKRYIQRDPSTDALSKGGIDIAELLAPTDTMVEQFQMWAEDPEQLVGKVRFEDGEHTPLTAQQIKNGLEELRLGLFGGREAHAVNMHALDIERAGLAVDSGVTIRTSEDVYGKPRSEQRPVLGEPGRASAPPAGLGRSSVPSGEPEVAGTRAGSPQTDGRGGLGSGAVRRGDDRVESPFPEAETELDRPEVRLSKREAAWTADRIDAILGENAKDDGRTKAWVGWVRPMDFFNANATGDLRSALAAETGPLATDQLAAAPTPMALWIDTKSTTRGLPQVVMHNGRHRMLALARAGVERVPVVVRDRSGEFTHRDEQSVMRLAGDFQHAQDAAGREIEIRGATPVTWENETRIRSEFGGDAKVRFSRRQEETPEFKAWSGGAPVVDLSGTRPRERLARESRQGEIRDDLGARAQRAKEWLGRDKGPEEASRYTALGYDFYAQELARNGGDEQAALGATIDLGYTPPTKGMSREEAMRQDVESHELERQGHQEAVDRWRAVEDDAKGNPPNANTLVETGKPVVLPAFHGTTSAGFAAFSKKMLGRETGAPSAKEAFFFTSQPDLANVYAKEGDTRGNVYGHVRGSGVYKTYVRMENPLVVDDAGRGRTPGMGYYGHIAEAKRQGRDGVIFLNTYDGGQEEAHVFAVFDNKQVKSALGNVGAFGQRAPTPEEAASLGMTGRGAKAAQARGDIRFSMRGASAQDADRKKLKTAQKMILAGQDEEEVRKETGWHQGTDKRWRWEGDDSQARIIMDGYRKIPYVADPGKNDGVPLGGVLQYDSMYRSYPEVANIRVVNAPRPIGSTVASFNEKTNVITLFPAVDGFEGGPLQAFLHEVQHWVQTKEAFAAGGNADTVLELIPPEDTKKIAEDAAVRILKQSNYHRDNVAALEEVIRGYEYHRTDEGSRVSVENVPDALGMSEAGKRRYLAATRWGKSTGDLERDLSDERRSIANIESRAEAIRTATGEELKKVVEQYGDAHDYYLRLAGEEEARQTQKRANLTPAERAERDPRLDFDNPPERQIVDMRRGNVRRSRRQEETPEFKKWFGKSKVVDDEGGPRVVYHGTGIPFETGAFDTEKKASDFGDTELGFFFTSDPKVADAFAGRDEGASQVPAYLSLQRPYRISGDKFYEMLDGESAFSRRKFIAMRRRLEKDGYDGIIVSPSAAAAAQPGWDQFKAETHIAFSPTQIKSATGNDGTFSKTNPDIRRSRRNSAESQISWEALPGKKTGWLRGIHAAPYEVRAAFTTDMDSKVLRDSMGRDRIARLFGVEETEQLVAPGYWKGERNPSRQLFVRVPDTPDGLERVKAYAAARGYVLRQEGVGFHLARNPNPGETPNGYHADMGRMPTSSEYADFIAGINKAATPKEKEGGTFVPVPTHAGINLWTWDGDITPERLREVYEAAAANVKSGATATLHPLVVDSELIENDWLDKGKNGEDYVQRYSATEGSPGVQSSLDQLRKAADKVGREWASRHGWGTRLGSPEPAVPGDLERLVGRDVNPALKGQRRAKLFKDIARLIDGRALADMKFAAESGRAMKGWYRESWQSIRKLFGDDADRFTGLLAALSPQQGVKENLKMAVEAWQLWTDAGKPTDPAAARALFPVIGRKWSAAQQRWINQYATVDMEARFNNAITALTDPGTPLSGDKVESFRRNLSGDFDAVTNDTWMAYFNDWEQKVFGSNSGYLAGSYLVRRAAKKLGWTPAEVQETVWTFFRELSNRADSRGISAMDEMATMTQGDVVANADSFAHLVRDPDVKKRLLGLGLDPDNLPDLPRLSPEEAAAPAVGPEDRATGVSRRVAGRAQRQNDRSWARGEIERAGIDGLNDADPAALRKLADAVGIPVKGRTRNQLVAALRTYADPAKYSRRLSDDPDWDLPLTPPQVEARVARLGAVEDSLAADKPGYEVKRLEREKDRPWTKVGPEAEKLDLVTDDDQWVRLASRKGRVLSDTEQQAINSRVQLRHDEMKTLVEKLEEATALSKDEAAARGIDVQALVKEEMAARLAYVAMERASVNAGTQAGRALAARRRIMAAGSDVTPDAMLRRIIKELPDVDKADAADLYRVYHQSPAEFTNALRLVMKPGAFRKGMEYWKAGLLSGLGTHVANVAGNTIEPAAQLAETLVAAGIDKAWSARTGKPRERFVGEARYELRGQLKALPMAFSRFVDEFKAQILRQEEPDISAAGPLEYQVGAIGPGWGVIPFDVGKAVRTPFRALTISDRFFKALGYEAELYKLAYRQARKDGFVGEKADQRADQIIESARQSMGDHWRSMVEQADEGMKQRVFQGEPIKIIRSLMTLTREHPAAGFMFPFLRTPAEITRRGWQRSPMGLVGGRRGATSAEYDRQQAGLEAKGGNVVGKGEVSDAWARPLVGTALATAFSGLAAIGMLTGGGPVDKDKKKLKLATGWQPYSVRIPKGGGKYLYLPYTRFEPLSSLLGIVADAFETGDERKVGDKIMGSIAQNYTNKQFWKGLNDFATAITSPDRSAKTVITPIVASALVPAVVAKTAEAIDPTFREKRSDPGLTGLAESTARATLRRIPGVSRGEEPTYTPLGDPAQRPGNAVTRFASPVQPSTTKAGTELEDWLVKINEAPSPIPGEVAIPKELLPRGGEYDQTGTRIVLTNEERAFLAKSRRDAASILRRDLESIKRMPLDDQRDRIQKAFKGAQREAISKLWLRSPELRERARKQVGARQ